MSIVHAKPARAGETPRDAVAFINVGDGSASRRIAVLNQPGSGPALVWLGGFRSDMESTKASALAEWGAERGRAVLRFDYSGHGRSGGRFEKATIGLWLEESLAAIDAFAGPGPLLVGSSMGGWLALLVARRLLDAGTPPSGLVLVAPAPDFTEELMWNTYTDEIRGEILERGVYMQPSDYSPEPYPITRSLIEEGRTHLLLGRSFRVGCPVHVLQGMEDAAVPWRHALRLVERLAEDDVVMTLVKDGDHRLSRPEDLDRLFTAIEALAPPA